MEPSCWELEDLICPLIRLIGQGGEERTCKPNAEKNQRASGIQRGERFSRRGGSVAFEKEGSHGVGTGCDSEGVVYSHLCS